MYIHMPIMGITKKSVSERGRVGWLVVFWVFYFFFLFWTCNYAQDLIIWGEGLLVGRGEFSSICYTRTLILDQASPTRWLFTGIAAFLVLTAHLRFSQRISSSSPSLLVSLFICPAMSSGSCSQQTSQEQLDPELGRIFFQHHLAPWQGVRAAAPTAPGCHWGCHVATLWWHWPSIPVLQDTIFLWFTLNLRNPFHHHYLRFVK